MTSCGYVSYSDRSSISCLISSLEIRTSDNFSHNGFMTVVLPAPTKPTGQSTICFSGFVVGINNVCSYLLETSSIVGADMG